MSFPDTPAFDPSSIYIPPPPGVHDRLLGQGEHAPQRSGQQIGLGARSSVDAGDPDAGIAVTRRHGKAAAGARAAVTEGQDRLPGALAQGLAALDRQGPARLRCRCGEVPVAAARELVGEDRREAVARRGVDRRIADVRLRWSDAACPQLVTERPDLHVVGDVGEEVDLEPSGAAGPRTKRWAQALSATSCASPTLVKS